MTVFEGKRNLSNDCPYRYGIPIVVHSEGTEAIGTEDAGCGASFVWSWPSSLSGAAAYVFFLEGVGFSKRAAHVTGAVPWVTSR